jgi:hypothetical protein
VFPSENFPDQASSCSGRVSADQQNIEEDLRSQLYSALCKLTFAPTTERAAIVARMRFTCRLLHEVVTEGSLPGITESRRRQPGLREGLPEDFALTVHPAKPPQPNRRAPCHAG